MYYQQQYSTHYSILGIPLYTSNETYIREAYETQSRLCRSNNAREEWIEAIQQAYEVLGDVDSRTSYDSYLYQEEERYQRQYYDHQWCREWEHYQRMKYHRCNQDHASSTPPSPRAVNSPKSTNTELKNQNKKLWEQVSCYIATQASLEREMVSLTSQLKSAQVAFDRREKDYVSEIRILKEQLKPITVASSATAKKQLFPNIFEETKKTDDPPPVPATVNETPKASNVNRPEQRVTRATGNNSTTVLQEQEDKENTATSAAMKKKNNNNKLIRCRPIAVKTSVRYTVSQYGRVRVANPAKTPNNLIAKRRKVLVTFN